MLQIPTVGLQCSRSNAQGITTHAKHKSTASTKKTKVTWNLQLHCARKTSRNRRRNDHARTRRASEPTCLRNGTTSVYPINAIISAHPNIQIASMMQQFQRDLPRRTCKTQSESQGSTAEQLPFNQRWRNHSTAICRHWVPTHNGIAIHYCGTHRLDAAVPTPNASQHMQNTKAQHQQRKEKVTWNLQFHWVRKTSRNRRQNDHARTRRASEPTFLPSRTSGYLEKHNVSCTS